MPLKVEFSFYPYLLSPTAINQFTLPPDATNIFPISPQYSRSFIHQILLVHPAQAL